MPNLKAVPMINPGTHQAAEQPGGVNQGDDLPPDPPGG